MRVEGTDASTLLQGVVTCDVFSGSEATYSMMLNVQVSLLDVRFLLVFTCEEMTYCQLSLLIGSDSGWPKLLLKKPKALEYLYTRRKLSVSSIER